VLGIIVRRSDKDKDAWVLDINGAEALLEPREQVPGEKYRIGQRLRVYVYDIRKSQGRGLQVMVSRTHRNVVKRLFELEVPEIFDGYVEIKGIAREPGSRSKVAVWARQEGLDPIGSCVGVRGTRINNIVNELNGEKIDIILWNADPATFVSNALSPVKPLKVDLRESDHTALVTKPLCFRPGATSSVTSMNRPWSLRRSRLLGVSGYLPGTTRPPTNKSRSPSRSKSAAATTLPESRRSGKASLGAFVKLPLPSLR